jgi:hypothetical protein
VVRVVVYVAIIAASFFYVVQTRQSRGNRSAEAVYLSPTTLVIRQGGILTVRKRDRPEVSGAQRRFGIAF